MSSKSVIVIDPEIMSGTPVFAGTRVPIQTLIDQIRAGDGLDVFLGGFSIGVSGTSAGISRRG